MALLVMLTSVGCPSTTEYLGPDPLDGQSAEPTIGREIVEIAAQQTSVPLRLFFENSVPTSELEYPAMQFDLSSIPVDAAIRSATLRMRRAVVTWDGDDEPPSEIAVELINVNSGLRIDEVFTIREVLTIEDASRTADEALIWADVEDENGRAKPAIQFVNADFGGYIYADLLAGWNDTEVIDMLATGAWDEIDVTQIVWEENRHDRSLTVMLRSYEDEVTLQWFGAGADEENWEPYPNYEEFIPHLHIEYSLGADDTPPTETPPAETVETVETDVEPTPAPADSRSVVVFTSEPGGARIYIDDVFVGTTVEGELIEIPLDEGLVQVRLVLTGFAPWEETLRVIPGASQRIHAVLVP